MKYLIDTHVLIWFSEGDRRLPERIRRLILDRGNQRFVSHASIWEMTIKQSISKLTLQHSLSKYENLLQQNHFTMLPSAFPHFEVLATLPFHHQDPFDRLMIAQAISENLTLISHDPKIALYPVRVESF